jgi:DNA-binding MarR family transcriptional regulator
MQVLKKSLVTDAREAVEVCAGWNARLAARRITQYLERKMQPSGLSIAQFGLMAQIAAAEDDTLSSLAHRTGLDQSTLSRNLRSLERDGYVEITSSGSDLRRRAVWLTDKGARDLETALSIWREAHDALGAVIDTGVVRALANQTDVLPDQP